MDTSGSSGGSSVGGTALVERVQRLWSAPPGAAPLAEVLASLGAAAGAERAYQVLVEASGLARTDEWCAPGVTPGRGTEASARRLPWLAAELEGNDVVHVEDVASLAGAAAGDREALERQGVHALVAARVVAEGRLAGWLALDLPARPAVPPAEVAPWLGLAAAALGARATRAALVERAGRLERAELLARVARGTAADLKDRFSVLATVVDDLREATGGGVDRTRLLEGLGKVMAAAEGGRELLARFLAASDGAGEPPVVVDLSDAVLELQDLLRSLLGERVDLRLDLSAVPCRARVERAAFDLAVLGLVADARDAMPRGGTVTVGTRRLDGGDGGRAVLEVRDEGVDVAARDGADGPAGGDRLSLASRLAERAGGSVTREDIAEGGARARLVLPATSEAASAGHRPERSAVPGGRGERVLVVEDDSMLRDTLRRLLSGHGYQVVHAGDALEALAAVEGGESLDLLLTDVLLPVGSGTALADSLRRRRPDLPVVFISARAGDPREAGRLAGSAKFLPKPFGRVELLSTVRQALDARR